MKDANESTSKPYLDFARILKKLMAETNTSQQTLADILNLK